MAQLTEDDARRWVSRYLGEDYVTRQIGAGTDGIVFETSRSTVVKAHEYTERYQNELSVYQRLKAREIGEINGFVVPRLLGHHRGLGVIEITVVSPPCIFDFGKSRLDWRPDFPPEVWNQWLVDKEDEFAEMWPAAERLYTTLWRRFRIWHGDLNRKNVYFAGERLT